MQVVAGLLLWFLLRKGYYRPHPGWLPYFAKVCVAVAMLSGLVFAMSGPDTAWLHAGALGKVGRLGAIIAAGAIVYFAVLYLLGFRIGDFERRETPAPVNPGTLDE